MERKASAVWNGNLKEGKGTISSDSGVLKDSEYSFKTRFENETGTNPEELIAAAHAGCFSMALSNELDKAGMKPESVSTSANVSLEKGDAGFSITKIRLETSAKVPGAKQEDFDKAAEAAKTGCPVSKVLNAEISLEAKLES